MKTNQKKQRKGILPLPNPIMTSLLISTIHLCICNDNKIQTSESLVSFPHLLQALLRRLEERLGLSLKCLLVFLGPFTILLRKLQILNLAFEQSRNVLHGTLGALSLVGQIIQSCWQDLNDFLTPCGLKFSVNERGAVSVGWARLFRVCTEDSIMTRISWSRGDNFNCLSGFLFMLTVLEADSRSSRFQCCWPRRWTRSWRGWTSCWFESCCWFGGFKVDGLFEDFKLCIL